MFGMRLNPEKTIKAFDIIESAIKPNKINYFTKFKSQPNHQKHLL